MPRHFWERGLPAREYGAAGGRTPAPRARCPRSQEGFQLSSGAAVSRPPRHFSTFQPFNFSTACGRGLQPANAARPEAAPPSTPKRRRQDARKREVGVAQERYAVWDGRGMPRLVAPDGTVALSTGRHRFSIATVAPVWNGRFAAFGLAELHTPAAALESVRPVCGGYAVCLTDGGCFAAWCASPPKRVLAGRMEIPFASPAHRDALCRRAGIAAAPLHDHCLLFFQLGAWRKPLGFHLAFC